MKCKKCSKRIWLWSNEHSYFVEQHGVIITNDHYHWNCDIVKPPYVNNPKGYNEYRFLKDCKCKCHNDGKFHVCAKCNCQELCDELNYIGTELQ